jgi:hypothetical protein
MDTACVTDVTCRRVWPSRKTLRQLFASLDFHGAEPAKRERRQVIETDQLRLAV